MKLLIRVIFIHLNLIVFIQIFGGAIYGYSIGIISGISYDLVACAWFEDADTSTATVYIGLITADIIVGGFFGSFIAVYAADKLGRRKSLLAFSILAAISTILLSILPGFIFDLVCRTLLGVACGAFGCLCPMYVSEMAPPERKGSIGTVLQVSICGSIFIAQLINFAFNPNSEPCIEDWKWRIQYGFGAIFCFAMTILVALKNVTPESSVWLKKKGKTDETTTVGSSNTTTTINLSETGVNINNTNNFDLTIETRPNTRTTTTMMQQPSSRSLVLSQLHRVSSNLSLSYDDANAFVSNNGKWFLVALVLSASQQLTGVNAVIFYAPAIFQNAGVSNPLVVTLFAVGLWNLLSVFVSYFFVEKVGRRSLLLTGLGFISLGSLLIGSSMVAFTGVFSTLAAIGGILIFIFGFEIGPGPMFFVIASETFPKEISDKMLGITNALAWFFNITVSALFPVVNGYLGGSTFLIFFAISSICMLFVYGTIAETGNPSASKQEQDSVLLLRKIESSGNNLNNLQNSTGFNRLTSLT